MSRQRATCPLFFLEGWPGQKTLDQIPENCKRNIDVEGDARAKNLEGDFRRVRNELIKAHDSIRRALVGKKFSPSSMEIDTFDDLVEAACAAHLKNGDRPPEIYYLYGDGLLEKYSQSSFQVVKGPLVRHPLLFPERESDYDGAEKSYVEVTKEAAESLRARMKRLAGIPEDFEDESCDDPHRNGHLRKIVLKEVFRKKLEEKKRLEGQS